MEWLAAIGGLSSLALGITAGIFWLRCSGLAEELRESELYRSSLDAALRVQNREFEDYRLRSESIQASLVSELEQYENEELDEIENEPDRTVRIRRRREWIVGLLSKATASKGHDDSDGMYTREPTE